MNERTIITMLGLVRRWALTLASLAGLLLLFSAPSGAQSTPQMSTPSAAKVVAPPSEQAPPAVGAPSRTNGKTEGIKVHGHWTIEVRNPDGTVVTHREFENSLFPNRGAVLLGSTLGRQYSIGLWEITLVGTSAPPCRSSTGVPDACAIFETGVTLPPSFVGPDIFTTLGIASGGSLVLSGTAVAGANGAIDQVNSFNWYCSSNVLPSACNMTNSAGGWPFTSGSFAPINVSTGQTVAVTVTFTFA